MDVLSLQEMVALEEAAFHSGITATALMEAAGEAMAARILAIYPQARNFLVLAGKGNNGGDGLVAARHLAMAGRALRVVLTAPEEQLGDLPHAQLVQLHAAFPNLKITLWHDDLNFPGSDGVVIDALLGVQARGPLRGVVAQVVATLNAARAAHFFRTVALDLPTGLAPYEDGAAPQDRDDAVVADVTIAVGFAKDVLVREALSAWVGRLEVVAWSQAATQSAPRQVLVAQELAGLLPRRNALSYKGDFGRLAIVAGSPGFTGAPVLCAQAALAMGAGLLSVVTRPDATSVVAAQAPHEAMVSGWPTRKDARRGEKRLRDCHRSRTGRRRGNGEAAARRPHGRLSGAHRRRRPERARAKSRPVARSQGPVLLTPHLGEMARLIGRKFNAERTRVGGARIRGAT